MTQTLDGWKRVWLMMPMATERLREVREWGTFILTLLTVALIPICLLALKNQRLETLQTVSERYVSKDEFVLERARLQTSIDATNVRFDKVDAKIDVVSTKADALKLSMIEIQVQLNQIAPRSTGR